MTIALAALASVLGLAVAVLTVRAATRRRELLQANRQLHSQEEQLRAWRTFGANSADEYIRRNGGPKP